MKTKILITGSTLLLVMLASCSDEAMDKVSKNPNNPTDVPSNLLISQVTASTAFGIYGTDLAWYSSVFVEQTTGVHGQMEDADKRTGINSTIGDNQWGEAYATLTDLNTIITKCSEGGDEAGNWSSVGIAKVLKVCISSVLTDLWGEVPYTEACKGSEVRYPLYDTQESIYTAMFQLLNEAIADLDKASLSNPGDYDFFYGGDTELWKKAAFALKARLFNRLSNVMPATYSDSVIAAASNSFSSNDESMIFSVFNTTASGEHPWYQEQNDRGHHAVSKTIDDIMSSRNDPRRHLWFSLIDGAIVPAPNGTATSDQAGLIYSRFTDACLSATSPMPIITYDEVKFLEAEAYLREGSNVDAYASYLVGVQSALERAQVPTDSISTYVAQAIVSPGSASLTLNDIILEKYCAFWLFQPIEAYNDYRRTGIPTMQNTISEPPSRFPYPNNEVSNNPNIPDFNSSDKVWWALY
jgi:hypothetical protein